MQARDRSRSTPRTWRNARGRPNLIRLRGCCSNRLQKKRDQSACGSRCKEGRDTRELTSEVSVTEAEDDNRERCERKCQTSLLCDARVASLTAKATSCSGQSVREHVHQDLSRERTHLASVRWFLEYVRLSGQCSDTHGGERRGDLEEQREMEKITGGQREREEI